MDQRIGRRILKIHVKDFSAKRVELGAKAAPRPKLLDGDTNWPAVMKALDGAGYSGWGISEQPNEQAADLESARNLAARMDRIFAL
jgi:L-ribulose-5-phosphate 3-epimerase